MKPKVVHADAKPDSPMALERAALEKVGAELICAGVTEPDDIIAAARDADVVITDHALIGRPVIAQLDRCLAIIRTGTGYDDVDLDAATEHGIIVINFPGYCTAEVANHTMMFLLACAKRLIWFEQRLRRSYWPEKYDRDTSLPTINKIYGEQLGIVGLGRIGRAVAERAKVIGMRISACDPYIEDAIFAQYEAAPATLNDVLENSDYVTLHTPLTDETRSMMGEEQFRRMKPSAYLINTSRGKVVDQKALIRALDEGWIAGAALDVFQDEPLPADSPLLEMDNVVLTPHVAGRSDFAFAETLPRQIGEEAARVLSLEWPETVVNTGVIGHSRLEKRRGD